MTFSDREPLDLELTDTDGDGYPDWWEQVYFGGSTGYDSQMGMNWSANMRVGSDGSRILNWIRRPARRYNLYWTTDLKDPFILIYEDVPFDTFEERVSDRLNAEKGFYKLEVISENLRHRTPIISVAFKIE